MRMLDNIWRFLRQNHLSSTAKKLAVVQEEAALVQKILADYLRLGSIGELAASLDNFYAAPAATCVRGRFLSGPGDGLSNKAFRSAHSLPASSVSRNCTSPLASNAIGKPSR
jgi:hypothetical protein